MQDALKGKIAIVTGAGRGLGRAMALGLARAGAHVLALAARERAEVEAVAAESPRIHPLAADVTNADDCARAVETAVGHLGGLHILVSNAGRGMKYVSENFMTEPTRFWEVEPESWRLVIDTNVNGPFLMARAAAPQMILNGWGRIINISVSQETMRRKGFSPYGPSKAALESQTFIWAQDLAGTGVTVNALLPGGATLTGMIPASFPAERRKELLDPAVIVPPLLWLASERSDGVTGERFVASRWHSEVTEDAAIKAARENAG
jgi:NAD(P)-dependent dehydrogenase (short-subunit alcohol dehydrogenase family)